MALTPGKLWVNTTVRVDVQFDNEDVEGIDPTTVSVTTRSPGGIETTYVYGTDTELSRESLGNYHLDFVPDYPGRWFYRWQSTGSGTAIVLVGSVNIQYSPFTADNPSGSPWPAYALGSG